MVAKEKKCYYHLRRYRFTFHFKCLNYLYYFYFWHSVMITMLTLFRLKLLKILQFPMWATIYRVYKSSTRTGRSNKKLMITRKASSHSVSSWTTLDSWGQVNCTEVTGTDLRCKPQVYAAICNSKTKLWKRFRIKLFSSIVLQGPSKTQLIIRYKSRRALSR